MNPRATDEEWAKAILTNYDWEGAVVPPSQWQRGSDMTRFVCARCNRPVSWEEGPRSLCVNCEPIRILLRRAIQTAREAL